MTNVVDECIARLIEIADRDPTYGIESGLEVVRELLTERPQLLAEIKDALISKHGRSAQANRMLPEIRARL